MHSSKSHLVLVLSEFVERKYHSRRNFGNKSHTVNKNLGVNGYSGNRSLKWKKKTTNKK
jgi:hypothetical protein